MKMFNSAFIESVLSPLMSSWFGSLSLKNKNKLVKIVRQCSKITEVTLKDLPHLFEVRVILNAKTIALEPQHPLYVEFLMLLSGQRFSLPEGSTNRYRLSFIPQLLAF